MDNLIEPKSHKQKESVKVDKNSKNPERLDVQAKVKQPKTITMNDFLSDLTTQINTIDTSRNLWKKRNTHFYKRRQGLRPAKSKPWRNCSNDTMMTEDKVIKKMNPAYFNMIWANKKLAEFTNDPEVPTTDQTYKNAQINSYVFDHIVRNKIKDAKRNSMVMIDRKHQDGKTFIKVTYDYKVDKREYVLNLEALEDDESVALANLPAQDTAEASGVFISFLLTLLDSKGVNLNLEKEDNRNQLDKAFRDYEAGETKLTIAYDVIAPHAPKWTVVKARDLIVHGGFNNIQDATMVCHRMKWTSNDLRVAIQEGKVKKSTGDAILNAKGSKAEINSGSSNSNETDDAGYKDANTQATGVDKDNQEEDLINIWEVSLYAYPDSSGVLKKCVLLYSPDYPSDNLKFITLPYIDGYWPYAEFVDEETDEGFLSSRGIPHKINFFSSGIDRKHNQRNDAVEVSTNPMVKYVEGQVTPSRIRFQPGQGVACKKSITDVDSMILNPGPTDQLLREQQILQYQVEDYIAVPDFTLSDPNSLGSSARTATEVSLKSQDRRSIFRVDLELFTERVKFLYDLTWSRHLQFGKSKILLDVSRDEEVKGDQIVWDRSIGNLKMQIVPTGSFENTNVQERRETAQAMIRLGESPIYGPMIKSFNVLQDLIASFDKSKVNRWMHTREGWEGQMQTINEGNQKKLQEQKAAEIELKKADAFADKDLALSKIEAQGKVDLLINQQEFRLEQKGAENDEAKT